MPCPDAAEECSAPLVRVAEEVADDVEGFGERCALAAAAAAAAAAAPALVVRFFSLFSFGVDMMSVLQEKNSTMMSIDNEGYSVWSGVIVDQNRELIHLIVL